MKIEKESQRYQALKEHAENKLKLENEEITQVHSKAQAEAMALQVSLRKAHTQIYSVENTVEHKSKENDELTRICDDIISKMKILPQPPSTFLSVCLLSIYLIFP